MPRGYWTCQRVENKLPCKHVNPNRKRKCGWCGKPRPARKRPAHLAALKEPYSVFLALNGGEWCGICGAEPTSRRKLDRDHCHKTGRPRGLLCVRCNRQLASWCDPGWLRDAADYLERTA
jgi:hypothetical protein